jgi:hypothetical protein
MDGIVRALHRTEGWSVAEAERGVDEFGKFLRLCSNRRGRLSPSRRLDAVWHAFLEQPERYREFSLAACGRVVGHAPGAPNRARYELARRLMTERYGAVDDQFWPNPDAAAAGVADVVAHCTADNAPPPPPPGRRS